MDNGEKLQKFYSEDHHFKDRVHELRNLALNCGLIETYKWNFPTYTFDNKNIIAICKFKTYYGIWFFNGVFLSDPKKIIENAQEGKTKAMRHWKFTSLAAMDKSSTVSSYIFEAIENHKKGLKLTPLRKSNTKLIIPSMLSSALETDSELKIAFYKLTLAKQREYAEYIATAIQEKTKLSRLDKIVPIILQGKGLNDIYRK